MVDEHWHHNIFQSCECRDQVVVLEHEPNAMPSELGDLRVIKFARIVTLDEQASAGRPVQQTYDVEQRALARAGRADESHELAFTKHEVIVVQDFDFDRRADIVRLADVLETQDFGFVIHGSPPRGRAWQL